MEIIIVAIPSLVTIIGFFVSYKLLKKEKRLDTYIYKNKEQLKKLINLPSKILFYIECYMLLIGKQNIDEKKFKEAKKCIFCDVLCYGSEDAVKILVYFEKLLAEGVDDESPISSVQIIAPLVLLLVQIKYDITNIKTSPKVWYVSYTSQGMLETEFYENSVKEINRIVDIMGLSVFLKITDMGMY